MTRPAFKFYGIGLVLAALEEFITQGVLKRNWGGWIIPTIIAFLPFLVVVRLLGKSFDKNLSESKAAFTYYIVSGGIGLAIEWFLIGLSPWKLSQAHPMALLALQIGMFSFWSSVAFVPRLLLDQREFVSGLRRGLTIYLICGLGMIYVVTFASPTLQPSASIISVIAVFCLMNLFYFKYFHELKKHGQSPPAGARSTSTLS